MTRHKLQLALISFAIAVLAISGASAALAADLTFSVDTIISLSSPAIDLTVLANSQATSLTVNEGSIVVTVPAGSSFIVTSASKGLNVSGFTPPGVALSHYCTYSYVDTVNIVASTDVATYTITPLSYKCTYYSGGGGGGFYTPLTNTSVVIASGAATTSTATVTLTLSATGATQMMISNMPDFNGAVWEPYATSKAWTLTSGNGLKTVYVRFMDASQNISQAVSDTITLTTGVAAVPATPATPAVPSLKVLPYPAAKTIVEIQANLTVLLENLAALQAYQKTLAATPATPATPSAASVPPSGSYKVGLAPGSKGNDVTALQNFLKSQGQDIYPEGLVTGYYGNLTKAAVGRFQLKNGIVKRASDPGYGYVGPKTRAKINLLLGL
jgi:hypothetical protein